MILAIFGCQEANIEESSTELEAYNIGVLHNQAMAKGYEVAKEQKELLGDDFDIIVFYDDVLYPEVIVKYSADMLGLSVDVAEKMLSDMGFTGNFLNDEKLNFNIEEKSHQDLLRDLSSVFNLESLPQESAFNEIKKKYEGLIESDVLNATVSVAMHTNAYWSNNAENWVLLLTDTPSNAVSYRQPCIDSSVCDSDAWGAAWGGLFGGLGGACLGAVGGSLGSCISQILRC